LSEKQPEMRWFGWQLDTQYKHIRILTLSDLHHGALLSSMKHFQKAIQFVKDNDDVRLVLSGDLCESTLKTSKGDVYQQVGSPEDQRDQVIETLRPVKEKILGMCTGNHEGRIYDVAGIDISKSIAKELHVPYRPEGILLKISFGDRNNRTEGQPFVFWQYSTHGYGGARTKSAKATKVERIATWIHADYYTMSHDHVVNVAPDIYLLPDNRGTLDTETGFTTGKITAHRKMLIKTNAFLKWGGYAEMGGFPPSDLATPVIYLLSPQSEYWNLFPENPRQTVKVLV
jgi:hypothetical protein